MHIGDVTDAKEVGIRLAATEHNALVDAKRRLDELFGRLSGNKKTFSHIKAENKQTHRVELTKTKAYRRATDQLPKMQELHGEGIVTMDEASDPPALTIVGGTAILRKVQKALRVDRPTPPSKKTSCDSCLDDDVDDFIKLDGCRHAICIDCFRGYCSAAKDGKFPLSCFQPGCTQTLSLQQLQIVLEDHELQEIFSASIRDYFERHPTQYSSCPGKDCTVRFANTEIEGADRRRLCPECLMHTCTHCNVIYHAGMSCREYEEKVVNESGFQRWMEEQGAKKCPKCNAAVQKDAGCNNVRCFSCKCDFCWVCLAVLEHQEVYGHLQAVHGGFFDEVDQGLNRIIRELGGAERRLNGLQ